MLQDRVYSLYTLAGLQYPLCRGETVGDVKERLDMCAVFVVGAENEVSDDVRIGDDRSQRAFFGIPCDPDDADGQARYRLVLKTVIETVQLRMVRDLICEHKGVAYVDRRIQPGHGCNSTPDRRIDQMLASEYVWSDLFERMLSHTPERLLLLSLRIGLRDVTLASTVPARVTFQMQWLGAWLQAIDACRERLRADVCVFVEEHNAQSERDIAALKATVDAAEWRTRDGMFDALQKARREERVAKEAAREERRRAKCEKRRARRYTQRLATRSRFAARAQAQH